jgi:hypothetical protein
MTRICSITRVIEIAYLLLGLITFVIVVMAARIAWSMSRDSFVQMIEQRQGMAPGGTKVIPDCSCTMQYLGTQVRGRDYFVHLRKLD